MVAWGAIGLGVQVLGGLWGANRSSNSARDAAEAQNDQARLALDQQKAENAAQLGAARIQSQEAIVQARINAAREREMMKQQS